MRNLSCWLNYSEMMQGELPQLLAGILVVLFLESCLDREVQKTDGQRKRSFIEDLSQR